MNKAKLSLLFGPILLSSCLPINSKNQLANQLQSNNGINNIGLLELIKLCRSDFETEQILEDHREEIKNILLYSIKNMQYVGILGIILKPSFP